MNTLDCVAPAVGLEQMMTSFLPRNVLVVADDEDGLAACTGALQQASIPCSIAGSAKEALETLDVHQEIDVVVADLRASEGECSALLGRLQALGVDRPWLRTVLITGGRETDRIIEAVRYGVTAFLRRPVTPAQLLEAVHAAVNRATVARAELARSAEQRAELRELRVEFERLATAVRALAAPEGGAERRNGSGAPAQTIAEPAATLEGDAAEIVDVVRRTMRARAVRAEFFPSDLFADPAWDMLLDLTLARLTGKRISVSSLCLASGVPATTALRRLDDLCLAGMTTRIADVTDGRRKFVELTEDGAGRMLSYLQNMERKRGSR